MADGFFNEESFFERLQLSGRRNDCPVDENNDDDYNEKDDFDIDDARACFGAIDYIINQSCLHGVSLQTLAVELEQLGLSSEHTSELCKMMGENLDEIRQHSGLNFRSEEHAKETTTISSS